MFALRTRRPVGVLRSRDGDRGVQLLVGRHRWRNRKQQRRQHSGGSSSSSSGSGSGSSSGSSSSSGATSSSSSGTADEGGTEAGPTCPTAPTLFADTATSEYCLHDTAMMTLYCTLPTNICCLGKSDAAYRALGVGEIWSWEDGQVCVYVLRGARCEEVDRSELLPGIDLPLVARLASA